MHDAVAHCALCDGGHERLLHKLRHRVALVRLLRNQLRKRLNVRSLYTCPPCQVPVRYPSTHKYSSAMDTVPAVSSPWPASLATPVLTCSRSLSQALPQPTNEVMKSTQFSFPQQWSTRHSSLCTDRYDTPAHHISRLITSMHLPHKSSAIACPNDVCMYTRTWKSKRKIHS